MLDSTARNSSANFGTSGLGHCACCHERSQVRAHWDHPDIKICEVCRGLLFHMEAHGHLTHTAYAFFNRLAAGAL